MGLGIICGLLDNPATFDIATVVSEITIKLMKFIALPLLFLSVVSSAAHFSNFDQIRKLGLKIFKYTLLTTLTAALIAEALFWLTAPYLLSSETAAGSDQSLGAPRSYFDSLVLMIPDNIVGVFLENNVIAVVVMAILLAIAILSIAERERDIVFTFFGGLLNAMMRVVRVGIRVIPVSVWAFVTLLTHKITSDEAESLTAIIALTLTVIAANVIQGTVILPLLLKYKGIKPLRLFLQVKEALLLAFFTRSSMAALPLTLEKAIDEAKISPDGRASLPLCTTINMNGCAQFILLSVCFVSASTGNALTPWEHIGMVFLSVIAAIGNAGVPMGCFFLASTILASKDIPLHIMASILPLYTFIDMVETALNVWSDVSITKVVDMEKD